MIHASAQIDPKARLADNVQVGAFSVIGADVEIGAGTVIGPHVVIEGPTRIGEGNHIHSFASIGGDAQDKKYHGERTELIIGDNNVFREFVTINRGTGDGGGATRIGNDNWFLAYVHIAHDCQVGNHTVFSNNASLAGHVEVGDWVIMAGFSGVHQFCKIGDHAFVGMGCLVGADVPPFVIMGKQEHGRPRGINSEGLKRRGFEPERIATIRRAYRTLYMAGLPLAEARERLNEQAGSSEDVQAMLDFIDSSERSLKR
ncbi:MULTISPECIES: acyl-ACP--UDP-N-acetylglucosamine O-acyltransferase [Oleiagrimonas]|jgi:UDP-N-acetylglucosamine acyltransferase|uniref:Acyl-[acyl-carrier-protein]--UDP-N-acetylglucosamine O-acyltransferase n=1 Tax=Oleiagrimonas citrea TaxID=1665687 RepID=A0A846ZGY1_9GAMM|nr:MULTISPECIES: acyl-ACP--UDP-N-acetylglucosamine O-acyltransferase [Oleiagrimonas]NKZ37935.1 acyl-ACP--UDP-N-acetylglucosamine O-acyltransferase [Oleiagrimonas citrea]RAP57431.1 acyl-[acyl-carrier-protein]--UDP-N-acetylglucosamine O-acyltransferase [Oleiagrimonas sp. MCCC 1A03011]